MKITRNYLLLIVACGMALVQNIQAEPGPASSDAPRLENLPPAVQKSLKPKIEGASILDIAIRPPVYCVQFDANGQKSELRVSEDGKVLRIRSKQEAEAQFENDQRLAKAGKLNSVALGTVPDIARSIIIERSNGLTTDRIVKTPKIYVFHIDRGGEKVEIAMTDDGSVVGASGP